MEGKVKLDPQRVIKGLLSKVDFNRLLIESLPVMLPRFLASNPMGQQLMSQVGMTPEALSALLSQGAKETAAQPEGISLPSNGAFQLMRHWQALTDKDLRMALEWVFNEPTMLDHAENLGNLLWFALGASQDAAARQEPPAKEAGVTP